MHAVHIAQLQAGEMSASNSCQTCMALGHYNSCAETSCINQIHVEDAAAALQQTYMQRLLLPLLLLLLPSPCSSLLTSLMV
jgi:hypothetical protein